MEDEDSFIEPQMGGLDGFDDPAEIDDEDDDDGSYF